jgi:transposase
MRGSDRGTGTLFSYVNVEERVPPDHPLRLILEIVNAVLASLSAEFERLYAATGRPSIAPEKLLRALLLQAFYSIPSERRLMEQLDFNLMFRWFVGLGLDDPVWDASTFAKNRERLLQAEAASKLLAGVVGHPRVSRLISREHFSVDGTLIEAWASMKSLAPIDRPADNGEDEGSGGGRNPDRDFRGERRCNQTHRSTSDPQARLYRKGSGKPAHLCYMGHVLMENRHGLAVGSRLTRATGTAEREAALALIDALRLPLGATLGADKAYDVWGFKQAVQARGLVPHMARRLEIGWGGLPIPKPPGYALSQRRRKRIEEIFGWAKTVARAAKTRFHGPERVGWSFTLAIAAYNLVRLPKLLAAGT